VHANKTAFRLKLFGRIALIGLLHVSEPVWKFVLCVRKENGDFLQCDATQRAVMSHYVVCLSVCPSVRLSVRDVQVPWSHMLEYLENNSTTEYVTLKVGLTPTSAIWSNGNTPKIGWNRGGVRSTKPAISPTRCKLGPRLLLRTNRKSHPRFRLVPKSVTLDDLADTSLFQK